jgi:hypothetical protein
LLAGGGERMVGLVELAPGLSRPERIGERGQ